MIFSTVLVILVPEITKMFLFLSERGQNEMHLFIWTQYFLVQGRLRVLVSFSSISAIALPHSCVLF